MHVSLIEPRQARRVTSFIAAGSATAAANRRASVVEAFELATSEAMRKAVDAVREAVPAPPR
jgi:hypothetical protein